MRADIENFCYFVNEYVNGIDVLFDCKKYYPEEGDSNSGINAMIAGEDLVEQYLLNHEVQSKLLRVIRSSSRGKECSRLIFTHQYYVTWRYLECVMGLLRAPVPYNLRLEATDYLAEEIGHEEHELEACLELGLRREQVREFTPSPLFFGYMERLDWLAQTNPVCILHVRFCC